jgi:hypothetical protein
MAATTVAAAEWIEDKFQKISREAQNHLQACHSGRR